MDEQLIRFEAIEKDWIPSPYPALRGLPDWYKTLSPTLPATGGAGKVHTIKQCIPVLDAMSAGYIIPLCGDVHFALDAAGQIRFECPNGDTSIELHNSAQVTGSPWADKPVIKFINPWIVVTPPGYSTLFVAPLNQGEIPFRVLSGVVDTDTFYEHVNFPAACLMERGTTCVLKRQTPLVQVIPFKREAWRWETGHADAQRLSELRQGMMHNHHVYREQFHSKKAFDKG